MIRDILTNAGRWTMGTLAALVLGAVQPSWAAPILVNFDNGNQPQTNWNNLSSGNPTNTGVNNNPDLAAGSVIDSTGAVVPGVSITTNGFDGFRDNGATGYGASGTVASWMNSGAARIGWLDSSLASPATIVFAGLSITETYKVELVSARSGAAISGTYTINGNTTATPVSSVNFSSQGEGWNKGTVLTWSSVNAPSGTLTLLAAGSNFPIVNAVRLSVVPEPAAVLTSGAAIGLLVLRRRQR